MRKLGFAACVAMVATLFVSGCASGSATITGTLVGADGHCLYVDVQGANGTDRYWLRHVPPGYLEDAEGLRKPDGSFIAMGESLTVSGALSFVPFDRQCAGARTLDATAIE